jgi:hypothetical protein
MDSEIIDIGEDFNEASINLDNLSNNSNDLAFNKGKKQNVNFGSGIELLMNEKRKSDGNKRNNSEDIELGDINDLENELNGYNDLPKTPSVSKSNLFKSIIGNPMGGGGGNSKSNEYIKLNDDNETYQSDNNSDGDMNDIKIGKETARDANETNPNKTWDGFQKFNDIPLDPSKKLSTQPQLTKEELLREKFKYLRKLEELENKGVKLSKKYSMESSLQEMQGEYEMIISEKEKSNSIKFQGKMLMACITGIEFLNNKFDPFDIKLDGWGEQINENINDYDEIFAELHEKYKSKSKMAPELKLLFQLSSSAIMVHMTNTLFKSSMPGMDDIMRQNPELMQQFTQAAVNSMGQTNPGFSGFMNSVMPNSNVRNNNAASHQYTQPPVSVPTQHSVYRPQPTQGMGGSRPDITLARNDAVNINDNYATAGGAERSFKRPEMKGPSDISDILSNIKTKSVNINGGGSGQTQLSQSNNLAKSNVVTQMQSSIRNVADENNSTISINDMDDIASIASTKQPKSKRGRPKSERNSVSLDI